MGANLERLTIPARFSSQASTPDPRTCDLSGFGAFKPRKGVEAALAAFRELASGKATWHMLMCYGTTGNGKTHLCEALAMAIGGRVIDWPEMIRHLKRSMEPDRWGCVMYDSIFQNLQKARALILDDAGSGASSTEWAWRELEDIVNYRYQRELLTVLTTNLDLRLIPDRIVSRFRDCEKSRLILNEAGDYRPEKGKS